MGTYPSLKVQVTQADIDAGIPEDACFCALARALRRLPNVDDVEVTQDYVRVGYKLEDGSIDEVEYETNEKVVKFIREFDRPDVLENGEVLSRVSPCELLLE